MQKGELVMAVKKTDLPRAAAPEDVGVYADVVEQLIEYMQQEELEFHSLMVLRHGKVAVEWYNEPFDAHTKHTMYSVSKSFTSTGVCRQRGAFVVGRCRDGIFPGLSAENAESVF